MSASITTGILSAVADRRTRDLRFRQRQLISLHRWVSKNVAELESAVSADDGLSDAEAQFVLALALDELRRNYENLDLKKELDVEFRIKNGRDNEERRLPEDIVYVIPDSFTLFYGVTSALCASAAAGSCCIVELSNNLRQTPGLIRRMVSQSLDQLAFGTTSTRPKDDFLKKCLVIDQQICVAPENAKALVRSQGTMEVVAIVDRTADVAAAAQAIATSTLLFAGKGPYTPSYVLVNEFVENEFSQAFEEYASATTQSGLGGLDRHNTAGKQEPVNGGLPKNSTTSSNARLTTLTDREDLNLVRKRNTRGPALLAVSSLDDAIDLVTSKISLHLLASYVFGDPKAAKYLAQFIRTDASFVNHIPASLLVGPAAPSGYPVSPIARYRREMIDSPSPQFVHCSPGSILVEELAERDSTAASALLTASLQPLKPMGQPREGDMNFFLQGLRVGFAVYIYLPMTIAAAGIVGYGGRYAYRHWG